VAIRKGYLKCKPGLAERTIWPNRCTTPGFFNWTVNSLDQGQINATTTATPPMFGRLGHLCQLCCCI
jgi:hypothetical protein